MKILKAGDSEEGENEIRIGRVVESLEELKLAYHLAESSMKNRKNLAKKLKYEFLLWLCGTRDIRNALEKSKGNEYRIVLDGEEISENHSDLKEKADPEKLEKISLSRI